MPLSTTVLPALLPVQEAWGGMAGAFDDDETVWKSPIPATTGKVKTDLEMEMVDLGHAAGLQCLYSYNCKLLSQDYVDMFHKHFVLVRPETRAFEPLRSHGYARSWTHCALHPKAPGMHWFAARGIGACKTCLLQAGRQYALKLENALVLDSVSMSRVLA